MTTQCENCGYEWDAERYNWAYWTFCPGCGHFIRVPVKQIETLPCDNTQKNVQVGLLNVDARKRAEINGGEIIYVVCRSGWIYWVSRRAIRVQLDID